VAGSMNHHHDDGLGSAIRVPACALELILREAAGKPGPIASRRDVWIQLWQNARRSRGGGTRQVGSASEVRCQRVWDNQLGVAGFREERRMFRERGPVVGGHRDVDIPGRSLPEVTRPRFGNPRRVRSATSRAS